MVKHKYFVSVLLLICLISFSSARLEVGLIDGGVSPSIGLNLNLNPLDINQGGNYSINTNSSDWLITNDGAIGNINTTVLDNNGGFLTIVKSWWDGFYCELTGCIMEGDIDMDESNILFTNSGSGIQRVINATSTNPTGVIGYELNNNVGASIALSVAGSGIADFANDSGIISRGGRTFIVNAADKSIVMGHGELPTVVPTWTLNSNGTVIQTGPLVMNGSAIFLDENRQHFIKENVDGFPFNGISTDAEWFGHDEFDEEGEITFLFTHGNETNLWMQSGKNNSFSSIGNSFFIVPTYMANNNFTENGVINMTKASSYLVLCDTFGVDCNFNADTLGNAIDLIPGGPLLGTMGDLEVWQSAKIHRGLSVEGPVFFDLEGNNANFNNGTVHIATPVTFEEGFTAGESVTKFTETFASGLGIFINIQSDLGNWVNVLNSVFCDEGECAEADGAGSGLVEMQTNFSTSDINETALSFVYSLVNLVGAGDFSIEVNNNVGSGDVEIFSDTTSSVIKSSQSISLPSSMDDQPLITLTIICDIGSSNKPTRQCFFDTAKINGTAITTTLINISGFNSIIAFSDGTLDAGGFPERGIFYNASEDQIIFRGNVTFENIIEQDLNITNSIELNGTILFDWGDIPDFFLLNGSSVMAGNSNFGGFSLNNIDDVTATGEFFLGSQGGFPSGAAIIGIDNQFINPTANQVGSINARAQYIRTTNSSLAHNGITNEAWYHGNSVGNLTGDEGLVGGFFKAEVLANSNNPIINAMHGAIFETEAAAGAIINNATRLRIKDHGGVNGPIDNYGIYIENTIAGTNNWALFSEGGNFELNDGNLSANWIFSNFTNITLDLDVGRDAIIRDDLEVKDDTHIRGGLFVTEPLVLGAFLSTLDADSATGVTSVNLAPSSADYYIIPSVVGEMVINPTQAHYFDFKYNTKDTVDFFCIDSEKETFGFGECSDNFFQVIAPDGSGDIPFRLGGVNDASGGCVPSDEVGDNQVDIFNWSSGDAGSATCTTGFADAIGGDAPTWRMTLPDGGDASNAGTGDELGGKGGGMYVDIGSKGAGADTTKPNGNWTFGMDGNDIMAIGNDTVSIYRNVTLTDSITVEERYFLGNGASIGFNTTCDFIFYDTSGGILSTLGC